MRKDAEAVELAEALILIRKQEAIIQSLQQSNAALERQLSAQRNQVANLSALVMDKVTLIPQLFFFKNKNKILTSKLISCTRT